MKIKKIETCLLPKPKGYYSQAIKVDHFIYTSGQLPINPDSGEVIKGSIEVQITQIIENIKTILEEAGSSLENVIKTTIFIRDINQWGVINSIYLKYFKNSVPPARSIIAGIDIHYGADIEMEAIAYIEWEVYWYK